MTEAHSISDLKPDKKNRRKHNQRNIGMIVDALHEVGAARSIVIDEDNLGGARIVLDIPASEAE